MSLLTKESHPTTWTREQARTFVSRVSGLAALAAGIVSLAAVLFMNH
jgi:hypothetical protein